MQAVKVMGIAAVMTAALVLAGCGGGGGTGGSGSGSGTAPVPAGPKTGTVGSKAPGFSLDGIDGNKVSLNEEGKDPVITLLVFWATWCPSCRSEIPAVERFHRDSAGKPVRVLAVSLDEGGKNVPAFVRKSGLTYTVAMDRDGSVGRSYGVQGIPYSVVIGRDGMIRHAGNGIAGSEKVIEEMLGAEEAPAVEDTNEGEGGAGVGVQPVEDRQDTEKKEVEDGATEG